MSGQSQIAIPTGPFAGKTVVVTGTLEKFTRAQTQEALRGAGATVTDSVSKKTDYRVAGTSTLPPHPAPLPVRRSLSCGEGGSFAGPGKGEARLDHHF